MRRADCRQGLAHLEYAAREKGWKRQRRENHTAHVEMKKESDDVVKTEDVETSRRHNQHDWHRSVHRKNQSRQNRTQPRVSQLIKEESVKEEKEEKLEPPPRPATWDDDLTTEEILQQRRFFEGESALENVRIEVKEEDATVQERIEVAIGQPTSIPPHQSLSEIVTILQFEAKEAAHLPFFELILEQLPCFIRRRYQVPMPGDAMYDPVDREAAELRAVASTEAARYPMLLSRQSSFIVHRIDRDSFLLKKAEQALRHFYLSAQLYRTAQTADGDSKLDSSRDTSESPSVQDTDSDDDPRNEGFSDIHLGRLLDIEPVFPLQVCVSGHPVVMAGPECPPPDVEKDSCSSLFWTLPSTGPYPTMDAILFGLQNIETKDDNFPAFTNAELRYHLKGKGSARGPPLRQGADDMLTLVPELYLPKEWTVDVWLKFPLQGLGPTRVLLASKDPSKGAHILFRDSKYVGCEVPPQDATWVPAFAKDVKPTQDPFQRYGIKFGLKNEFCPACRMSSDCTRYVRNLSNLSGWHRLTVTCDGTRQLFYIDGLFIGSTHRTPLAPVSCIGNRVPLKNCAIGAIARLRILKERLNEETIAAQSGVCVPERTAVLEDLSQTPGWEPRD